MSKITAESLLSTLPRALAEDENLLALASATADSLAAHNVRIEDLLIYANIDNLPEDLLDMLAYDFKVDWWDYSYSLEEKRKTLKRSWYVHKYMGTTAAVKTALSSIYPSAILEEWFDYDGEPYHFRLIIPIDEQTVDPVKHDTVMKLVRFYKNLRSVLDSVSYTGASSDVSSFASALPLFIGATYGAVITEIQSSYLYDENENFLLDENGDFLTDQDE